MWQLDLLHAYLQQSQYMERLKINKYKTFNVQIKGFRKITFIHNGQS